MKKALVSYALEFIAAVILHLMFVATTKFLAKFIGQKTKQIWTWMRNRKAEPVATPAG